VVGSDSIGGGDILEMIIRPLKKLNFQFLVASPGIPIVILLDVLESLKEPFFAFRQLHRLGFWTFLSSQARWKILHRRSF